MMYIIVMYVLGIESSCDDMGIALIDDKSILHHKVLKQDHINGVIPEYAARAHYIAIHEAVMDFITNINGKIDLIAYTNGPGLIGSLFVGSSFAKGLAYGLQVGGSACELIAVQHIHGHILLPLWMSKIEMPALCLTASGEHTMIIVVHDIDQFEILSKTLDDAAGEAFDKIARVLGLQYPGGPNIEIQAKKSNNLHRFTFPIPMQHADNFSFSGLKTASINMINSSKYKLLNEEEKNEFIADFSAGLQDHIAEIFIAKLKRAILKYPTLQNIIVTGGVAANLYIRGKINKFAEEEGKTIFYPDTALCTDNGVMIAAAGLMLYNKIKKENREYNFHDYTTRPNPTWKI